MDQTVDELGSSDALAVFKARLASLKEERGFGKWNWFSDSNKEIRDLQSKISAMETAGVKPGEMSGSKFENNVSNFGTKVENRANLEKEFKTKRDEAGQKVLTDRMNAMPEDLKDMIFNDPTNPRLKAYNAETTRQYNAVQQTIRDEYLPQIKNIEVQNKNKVKEVSSVNKNNNTMGGKIIPFSTGGGKQTGGGQKLVNSNANTTTSSDIAWFNSRNTDMYGCFKTAAECNITV